jgi:hypothetical protein
MIKETWKRWFKKNKFQVKEELSDKDWRTRKKKYTQEKNKNENNNKTSNMNSSDSLSLVQGPSTVTCMMHHLCNVVGKEF